MRLVDQAAIYPARCAVFPQVGGNHPDGYIDSLAEMSPSVKDSRVYVSVVGVREMARKIGWVSPEDVAELNDRIAALERSNDDLAAQVVEADRFAEAAEYTLGRFGSKVQKKPGRRPKEAVSDG